MSITDTVWAPRAKEWNARSSVVTPRSAGQLRNRGRTDLTDELGKNGIHGLSSRLSQVDDAEILAFIVSNHPRFAVVDVRQFEPIGSYEARADRDIVANGLGQDDRLEDGTGLTALTSQILVQDEVRLRLGKIPTSYQRPHTAQLVQHDNGSSRVVLLSQRRARDLDGLPTGVRDQEWS